MTKCNTGNRPLLHREFSSRVASSANLSHETFPPVFGLRGGQLSAAEIIELQSVPLANFSALAGLHRELWGGDCNRAALKLCSAEAIAHLGAPCGKLKGYESNPSDWLLDNVLGVSFVIFSDGLNRRPFKGTSYEAVVPRGMSDSVLQRAVRDLYQLILGEETPALSRGS